MTKAEADFIHKRIAQWENAAPVLQRVREEDIRSADTVSAIEAFDGFFRDAAAKYAAKPTSGLVEQQYWFRKLAGK